MDSMSDVIRGASVKVMSHKGFEAVLRRAEKLEDNGHVHGLPAGQTISVFPLDSLPGAPESWVREPGSFVCPVRPNWALWFDWTMNDSYNTAIMASVKGMNPITGLKIDGIGLHKYDEKCPKHGCDFKGDRFCPECEYKWPPQNYVCSPNTLWWDGFRQPDGSVRQFFFSEDESRDIASLVIGEENTVPAFGFVFYKTKEKVVPPHYFLRSTVASFGGSIPYNSAIPSTSSPSSMSANTPIQEKTSPYGAVPLSYDSEDAEMSKAWVYAHRTHERSLKRSVYVAVGAGAKIRQELKEDDQDLSNWKEEPSSMIRLYFVFEEQFTDIVKGGVLDLNGKQEGFLDGLPVG